MLERCLEALSAEGRPHFVAMVHLAQMVCVADESDWAGCRRQLDSACELLHQTGFIDFTIPRLAQMAALRMVEAGKNQLAGVTYGKCLEWWRRLGHEDRIVEVQTLLKQLN